MITEQELHDYNKWLMEKWTTNQFRIPFVEDAPRAYLKYRKKQRSEQFKVGDVVLWKNSFWGSQDTKLFVREVNSDELLIATSMNVEDQDYDDWWVGVDEIIKP